MKLFICALVVLALIASFCIFGAIACTAIIDEMVDLLDTAAPQGDAAVPAHADRVSDALLQKWNEHFFCISMFLPRRPTNTRIGWRRTKNCTSRSHTCAGCCAQMRTILYRKRFFASFFLFSLELP